MKKLPDREYVLRKLAKNVERAMRADEIGVRKLGGLSYTDPMTISRMLNEKHLPSLDAVVRISRVLGCQVDDLLR